MPELVGAARRKFLLPLALAQFICSFAGSNMNVMINDISEDLDTTVQGVQLAITLFLLIMAILMIPGSKLTDRWGRKRCFIGGLMLYGVGALLSALSPGLGVLILGNSVLEGVGTALLIPPVYILTTMAFSNLTSRARAFGVISGLGGIGAAAGPLIGGLITTGISWRAAFVFQAAVVATIIVLSRRMVDPKAPDPTRPFDVVGAILSAAGMFFVVVGVLQADSNIVLMAVLLALGAVFLLGFFLYIRARERAGKEPLLSIGLFRNRVSNLGLVTQNIQWLLLMGTSFVVAVFLQTIRLQRDRDRRHLHGRDARRSADVVRCGAIREEAHAEDVDRGGLRHNSGRHRTLARVGQSLGQRPCFRARAFPGRLGSGNHADSLGERCAIQLPRGAAS
jgi:MFS family permease